MPTPQEAMAELARRELARRGKPLQAETPKRSIGDYIKIGYAVSDALPKSPSSQLMGLVQKPFTRAGEITADALGKKGFPGTGATIGTGVSMLPDLAAMFAPSGEAATASKILKPVIPEGLSGAVRAAEELKVPLTRAEKTGSMVSAGLESALEKTPLGSRPIQEFRTRQAQSLDAVKSDLQNRMGTSADLFSVGQKAIGGLKTRAKAMQQIKNSMFEAVPDNVNIPLNESRKVADTIIHEQSKFLPATRNSDVTSLAENVQNAEKSLINGEPNYPLLKRLREVLNARIRANNAGVQSGLPGQSNAVARDYTRLKSALDKDIEHFVANQRTPIGSMIGKEFSQSYRKANAYSGAFSNLFKGEDALSLADSPPERIIDSVFKKNNETAIKRFRALVGEDGFQGAKKKFTQDLLESRNLTNELKKYKLGTLSAIYTTPELQQIKKYAAVKDLAKGAEKVAGNPSGTGRQVISAGSYGGASYALGAGHPLAAAGILGLPWVGAKALLSDAVRGGLEIPGKAKTATIRALIVSALERQRKNQ